MASPRFAVYISVPGAATGTGLVVTGIDALTARNCAAVAAADGLAVWASAVNSEEERDAICHAAAAKKRQETPVMIRTDEWRKRSSEKVYRMDSRWARCGSLVTGGVTRSVSRGSVLGKFASGQTELATFPFPHSGAGAVYVPFRHAAKYFSSGWRGVEFLCGDLG